MLIAAVTISAIGNVIQTSEEFLAAELITAIISPYATGSTNII